MGRSYFLTILLVSVILTLSFSNGSGRKLLQSFGETEFESEFREGVGREAIELMDYGATGPNFNSKSGLPNTPPLPLPAPSSV